MFCVKGVPYVRSCLKCTVYLLGYTLVIILWAQSLVWVDLQIPWKHLSRFPRLTVPVTSLNYYSRGIMIFKPLKNLAFFFSLTLIIAVFCTKAPGMS